MEIPPEFEEMLNSLTPECIIEDFMALEIEQLLELSYPQDENGDLIETIWECKVRNIMKKRFIEFYGVEGWTKFEVILRENLEQTETDVYPWEDHYSCAYDPDYPEKLKKEFEKYLVSPFTSSE